MADDCLGGLAGMTVDHFKCQKRHQHLISTWSNLYYSCSICNEHYKKHHPTEDEEKAGLGFIDPCERDYNDYFRLARQKKTGHRCMVRARKPEAEFAIEVLRLNLRPDLRDFWRTLEEKEAKAEAELAEVRRLTRGARRMIKQFGQVQELVEQLEHLRRRTDELVARILEIRDRRPFTVY